MCFTVFVSTDSPEDLSQLAPGHFRFRPLLADEVVATDGLLAYAQRWHVSGRHGGCSCHLRHQLERNIEGQGLFHEPFEWAPEDESSVVDTAAIYDVFKSLASNGANVDVVDLWNGEYRDGFDTITVSLSDVSSEQFQFVENRRFLIVL